MDSFNRRRDACFPATPFSYCTSRIQRYVSIADATLASPQLAEKARQHGRECWVSIADATLASPQRFPLLRRCRRAGSFNRRRDACFPATWTIDGHVLLPLRFNRRRDACF